MARKPSIHKDTASSLETEKRIASLHITSNALREICAVLLAVVAMQSKNTNGTFQLISALLNWRIDNLLDKSNKNSNNITDLIEKMRVEHDQIIDLAQNFARAKQEDTRKSDDSK